MRSWWWGLIGLLWSFCSVAEQNIVHLYTYHNKPPFIVNLEQRQGLYFDLAELLNQYSRQYQFETHFLPRKRLDHIIKNDELEGVVLGVDPVWFGDPEETKFLWLPAIYQDSDNFVSLKSNPFEYTGKDSLRGKTLASVAGYYYFGINEAVQEGSLKRIDTVGEKQVLALVAKQRADLGIVSQSTYKYLVSHHQLETRFHFSQRKHDEYARRAFTASDQDAIHQHLLKLIQTIKANGSWQATISKYE